MKHKQVRHKTPVPSRNDGQSVWSVRSFAVQDPISKSIEIRQNARIAHEARNDTRRGHHTTTGEVHSYDVVIGLFPAVGRVIV
eukprot:3020194-Pyramimonas_sp.AAC.1